MGDVPGLTILSNSYQFAQIVDTAEELEITTFSNVQQAEAMQLQALGWKAKAANVYVYYKPSTVEVDVVEEIEENFENAVDPPPEEEREVVEEDVPPSAAGFMDDV